MTEQTVSVDEETLATIDSSSKVIIEPLSDDSVSENENEQESEVKEEKKKKKVSTKLYDHLARVRPKSYEAMRKRGEKAKDYDRLKKELEEYKAIVSVLAKPAQKVDDAKAEDNLRNTNKNHKTNSKSKTFKFGQNTTSNQTGFLKRRM